MAIGPPRVLPCRTSSTRTWSCSNFIRAPRRVAEAAPSELRTDIGRSDVHTGSLISLDYGNQCGAVGFPAVVHRNTRPSSTSGIPDRPTPVLSARIPASGNIARAAAPDGGQHGRTTMRDRAAAAAGCGGESEHCRGHRCGQRRQRPRRHRARRSAPPPPSASFASPAPSPAGAARCTSRYSSPSTSAPLRAGNPTTCSFTATTGSPPLRPASAHWAAAVHECL